MKSPKRIPDDTTADGGKSLYGTLFRSHTLPFGGILRCTEGPHQGLYAPLEKEVLVVGRAAWCDLPLPKDPQVSRYHCEILLSEEGIRVRDLGSQNGTFIENVRVFEALLSQTFRVGASLFSLETQANAHRIDVKYYDQSGNLVGRSMEMRKIFAMLGRLSQSDASVLLRGETGTGKSSVARALHEQSARAMSGLVTVNCGALSPTLIEASLFGYEKGAFTGADRQHIGFFEQAHNGTLFLDEIGELPLELQPKLLGVLERKKIHRLGGTKEIDVDFRLITATHSDLKAQIAEKSFREDLYYRLAVAEIEVPALRERLDDMGMLAAYLLHQLCPEETPMLTPKAIEKLREYRWSGNIRQLRNVLERTLIFLEHPVIDADDLLLPERDDADDADDVVPIECQSADKERPLPMVSLKELLQREERRILLQVVDELGWDIPLITKRLQVSRTTLYSRFQKLDIKRP